MSFLERKGGALHLDGVPLADVAERFGTPCYVYSRGAIEAQFRAFDEGLAGVEHLVCYAVKAGSNLAILDALARLGAGFDIVSGGELARVLAAGGEAAKTLFSGVGKREDEIEFALKSGIGCLNIESEAELARVASVAKRLGKRAPIALRVNPDIDARTHPYISTGLRETKFGVPYEEAENLYRRAAAMREIEVVGVGCHIGSQLTSAGPFVDAAGRIAALADRLARAGIALRHIDIGGGIGIRYRDEKPESIGAFLDGALGMLAGRKERLMVDPGRSIVGNAGVLLTRVEYVKASSAKKFLVVDAAMNDLVRPALYGAWHDVIPARKKAGKSRVYDVVGPVCESADFLAQRRALVASAGDVLAILSAGAYGMVLSSNYNSRPRAAEILVDRGRAHLVRARERVAQLFASESLVAA